MTLDETIISAKEVSEIHRRIANIECEDSIDDDIKMNCLNCAEEHEQLATWLEELKAYQNQHDSICEKHHVNTIEDIYNKAIDDFANKLKSEYQRYDIDDVIYSSTECYSSACEKLEDYIDKIAEQLKGDE